MELSSNAAVPPLELPVELVREILELTARVHLVDDAPFAASLQILSRAIRNWMQPILYRVFVVHLPPTRADTPRLPSFELFLRMLLEPHATPRRHIRHLILHGKKETTPLDGPEITTPEEWRLDSIAIWARGRHGQLLHYAGLTAPRLILPLTGLGAAFLAVTLQTQHLSITRWGWAWVKAGSLRMMRVASPFLEVLSSGPRAIRFAVTQAHLRPPNPSLTLILPVHFEKDAPVAVMADFIKEVSACPNLWVILEIDLTSAAVHSDLARMFSDSLAAAERSVDPGQWRVRLTFVTETVPTDALEYAAWLLQGNDPWPVETNSSDLGLEPR